MTADEPERKTIPLEVPEMNTDRAPTALGPHGGRSVIGGMVAIVVATLVTAWSAFAPPSTVTAARGTVPPAKLTTVAEFPAGSFLENVTMRADGSMLVSELKKKELWYIPARTTGTPVQPVVLHRFDQPPYDPVETERDVFYLNTSNYLTTRESFLYRVDLRHWKPGMPVTVQQILKFPSAGSSVNGSCLLAARTILVADSLLGLIWRVDLSADGATGRARVWLKDPSMDLDPLKHMNPPQPGINGLGYAAKTKYLYYTSTMQQLFMRVRVNPTTLNPTGHPELVAKGSMWDDFDIDEDAGVAYITTHRQNSIERVALDPHRGQAKQTVASIIGPSSLVWGRGPKDYGSLAYVTTDGGVTAPPPDGLVRPAKLLRIELSH